MRFWREVWAEARKPLVHLLSHGLCSLVAYFLVGLGDHIRRIWIEGDPVIPILNMHVSGWILLADVVIPTVLLAKGAIKALRA